MSEFSSKRMVQGEVYHLEQYEGPDSPFKAGVEEIPTMTCSHCNTVVLLNPERRRDRGRCWNCDRYLCDACNAIKQTFGCTSVQQKMDLAIENLGAFVSIGMMRPTRDFVRLAEYTRPYPGYSLPRKD